MRLLSQRETSLIIVRIGNCTIVLRVRGAWPVTFLVWNIIKFRSSIVKTFEQNASFPLKTFGLKTPKMLWPSFGITLMSWKNVATSSTSHCENYTLQMPCLFASRKLNSGLDKSTLQNLQRHKLLCLVMHMFRILLMRSCVINTCIFIIGKDQTKNHGDSK